MTPEVTKDWIQTWSGLKVCPTRPDPTQFRIKDIARALSFQCRYAGHVRRFFSVAEHSVRVSEIVESRMPCQPVSACDYDSGVTCSAIVRWGLIHDASEAYLGDVTRPLKHTPGMEGYRLAEAAMQGAIAAWLGLPTEEPDIVKAVDTEILGTEARQLKFPVHPDWAKTTATGELQPSIPGLRVGIWTPAQAERAFLRRFNRLFPNHSKARHG